MGRELCGEKAENPPWRACSSTTLAEPGKPRNTRQLYLSPRVKAQDIYFLFGFLALKNLSLEVDVSVAVLSFCQKPTGRSSGGRKRCPSSFGKGAPTDEVSGII